MLEKNNIDEIVFRVMAKFADENDGEIGWERDDIENEVLGMGGTTEDLMETLDHAETMFQYKLRNRYPHIHMDLDGKFDNFPGLLSDSDMKITRREDAEKDLCFQDRILKRYSAILW